MDNCGAIFPSYFYKKPVAGICKGWFCGKTAIRKGFLA